MNDKLKEVFKGKVGQQMGQGEPLSFKREHTGKIRIVEILDEHFARATLVSGKGERGYIVELSNP